jgi:hypothetical protein
MGWQVRTAGSDANWWHGGSLDGTTTFMVRAGNGFTWVAFFNSRPSSPSGRSDPFGDELDSALWRAFAAVRQWPDHDLFAAGARYATPPAARRPRRQAGRMDPVAGFC